METAESWNAHCHLQPAQDPTKAQCDNISHIDLRLVLLEICHIFLLEGTPEIHFKSHCFEITVSSPALCKRNSSPIPKPRVAGHLVPSGAPVTRLKFSSRNLGKSQQNQIKGFLEKQRRFQHQQQNSKQPSLEAVIPTKEAPTNAECCTKQEFTTQGPVDKAAIWFDMAAVEEVCGLQLLPSKS